MDNKQKPEHTEGFSGYETPGQDDIIKSTSEAVPSPSMRSEDRVQAPSEHIGGRVNETPGDSNPAIAETVGYETGQTNTADLLRAREGAEEQGARERGREMYVDQPDNESEANNARSSSVPIGGDPEDTVYREQEFGRPTEPSELDLLGGRGSFLPDQENNER